MSDRKYAVVYSQNNCQACNTALSLLAAAGYTVDVLKLEDGNKQALMNDFPAARSVPQIIVDGNKVGGLDNLRKYMAE